jgi:hypothetical protein
MPGGRLRLRRGHIKQYAWDGVNIAELNYDTLGGLDNPKGYLPMGAATRTAFRATGGFDPIRLFDPESPYFWRQNAGALRKFEQFRAGRVLAWHRALLERVTPLAAERDMEVIVTMLDSLAPRSTVLRDAGVDSSLIVSLMRQFPFTLQVEDPAQFWGDSPERYKQFTEAYLKLVPDRRRLMFDINVVPDRNIAHSAAPVETLLGIELAQSLNFATMSSGRAALYSEFTIPFEDLQLLSRVLAHNAVIERRRNAWVTESERSVLLSAPGQWQKFLVDGKHWPGWGDNEVFIPGGTHQITPDEPRFRLVDRSLLDIRLLRFTGNLDTLAHTGRGLEFTYDSQLRTLALFNRKPFEIQVDGRRYDEPATPYSGHWSARLPRGRHRVEIVADSAPYVILDSTSLYSSTLIVIFGGVASGLMFLLYMSILARRAFGRAVRGKAAPSRPQ